MVSDFSTVIAPRKNSIQHFMEVLLQSEPPQAQEFLKRMDKTRDDAAWLRYINAMAGFPKTWWIGIFQMQMVAGIWGAEHQASAMIRQNTLQRMLNGVPAHPDEAIRIAKIVVYYAYQNRKADIVGRFHGGFFTSYALAGGRAGASLPTAIKIAASVTNLSIASFGSAIWAVGSGLSEYYHIVNSILMGNPTPYLGTLLTQKTNLPPEEIKKIEETANLVYSQMSPIAALNRVQPNAVPLSVFCSRPENMDLKKLCK
jgi:hypothetical protein